VAPPGWALALATYIGVGRNWLTMTNALAYNRAVFLSIVKNVLLNLASGQMYNFNRIIYAFAR
jgi:hypothetical protein